MAVYQFNDPYKGQLSKGLSSGISGALESLTQSKILLWTRSIVRHFTFSNRKEIDLAEVQAFLQKEIRDLFVNLKNRFFHISRLINYLLNSS